MFGGSRYFGLRGQKLNLFPEIDSVNNPTDTHISTIQGITVASYNVGCFIGAIITIFIGDILGRRKMIFLGSAIMVVGAALQASAFSLPHLIVGRIITGFGNGMNTSTVPTWAAETSKSHKRGKMVMIEGAMITGGIALSYWWLLLKGNEHEAISVIAALEDLPQDDHVVQTEFMEIKDTVLEMKSAGWADLFTMGPERNFHRVALGMAILAGMNYMSSVNLGGSAPGIVSAVFLFVFNTFFAVGWLGMTWLYPAEIVPLKIRAPSNGLSTSANWAFNFMVVMITPVSFTSIGYKTYIIFAVINAFIFPVVYFFYPETAYRSLEEIDNIFRKTSRGWRGWFDVVKIARDEPRRYGKHGELLIEYENTDEHRRRSSVAATDKPHSHRVENAHQETTTNSAGSSDYEKRRTDVV
ncbi:putative Sugar transporter STL1 [Glarea lozoyensis 74030]|uniref:Putative Sugar transporter STL1 n=1 Tax=Glarea lozoyensis (strain ATCC 74030 / MF5533) TaxID=1104152 RepID=H0EZ60_GLAL7|nr:putative Sugar transporter STL1 [Glarea lozoyensis 74030]